MKHFLPLHIELSFTSSLDAVGVCLGWHDSCQGRGTSYLCNCESEMSEEEGDPNSKV